MNATDVVEIDPKEAAEKIRQDRGQMLILGNEYSVMMANEGIHSIGAQVSHLHRNNFSPIAICGEGSGGKDEVYLGRFMDGTAERKIRFSKKGCRRITNEEFERLLQSSVVIEPEDDALHG